MTKANPTRAWFVLIVLALIASTARAGEVFVDAEAAGADHAMVPGPSAYESSMGAPSADTFSQDLSGVSESARNVAAVLANAQAQAPSAPSAPGPQLTRPAEAFSEDADISNLLVSEIDKVQKTLDLRMHGCSLQNIVDAVARAAARGVKVRLIMEASYVFPDPKKGQHVSPQVQGLMDLANAKKIDMKTLRGFGPYGVEHNKIGLFDGELVTFGSFNWTNAANTLNHENLVFSDDNDDIDWEQDQFDNAWDTAHELAAGDPGFLAKGFALSATASDKTVTYKGQTFPKGMSSPNGAIEASVVRAIGMSKTYVHMAMFSFYSMEIAKALVAARDRGLKVQVVLERSQAVRSVAAKFLFDNNIDFVYSQPRGPSGVLHDKFTVFDGEMLETGSFNYTNNAEMHNFENAHYRTEPGQVGRYDAKYQSLYAAGLAAGLKPQASDFHLSQAPSGQGDTNNGPGQNQ